ncbi:MAG: LuxR C-terminal-related transcriptional regulator, partial [Firmicutes bacterium]|nr:LuxR C-terminal-related transcriptional regulator [Bacillota bacterium]
RVLVISERTVDAHVRHILDKLGFDSRTQVAVWVAASDPATPGPS